MKKGTKLIFLGVIAIIFGRQVGFAQSLPFSSLIIVGKIRPIYNKVSLFESGRSHIPLKTSSVSSRGRYSIKVNIPKDLVRTKDYFYIDVRFWRDENDNNIKDPSEPISRCHFIIWLPQAHKVFF